MFRDMPSSIAWWSLSKGLLIHGLRFLIDFRICFYRFSRFMTVYLLMCVCVCFE